MENTKDVEVRPPETLHQWERRTGIPKRVLFGSLDVMKKLVAEGKIKTYTLETMPVNLVERIKQSKVDPKHDHLNALLDDSDEQTDTSG